MMSFFGGASKTPSATQVKRGLDTPSAAQAKRLRPDPEPSPAASATSSPGFASPKPSPRPAASRCGACPLAPRRADPRRKTLIARRYGPWISRHTRSVVQGCGAPGARDGEPDRPLDGHGVPAPHRSVAHHRRPSASPTLRRSCAAAVRVKRGHCLMHPLCALGEASCRALVGQGWSAHLSGYVFTVLTTAAPCCQRKDNARRSPSHPDYDQNTLCGRAPPTRAHPSVLACTLRCDGRPPRPQHHALDG